MNQIKELFGVNCCHTQEVCSALKEQICPFTRKKCYKTRKSDPTVIIGTCSVEYRGENLVICPNRLIENSQVFFDCMHLLSLHEPGNTLYVVPEITIPGGHVDYFLISAREGKVCDFAGIELQALDTTGTIWPARQRMMNQAGLSSDTTHLKSRKHFGINWKMTAKTILMQMHHKARFFEQLNKHLVLVIQTPLLRYIRREFCFEHISTSRLGDPIHIFSYDIKEKLNGKIELFLDTRLSTDATGVASCLGSRGQNNVTLERLISSLEQKLCDKYRLTLSL